MERIHQYICSVIPPHIFRHVAARTDGRSGERARATLEQMTALSEERQGFHVAPGAARPPAQTRRHVYDAQHRHTLPGRLVMSEHKKRGTDIEVNEAYDGSGATSAFYAAVFGRNSIDDRGMRIDSTVHYGSRFDNAMWNGEQMVYGDGDGKLFNRFTAALDVIGHEITHGVTQFASSLGYSGQTGALNEHISDAFGIMIKQHKLGLSANESDWLIGEGLFGPTVQGKAVRSMAAPGTAYDDPILGRDPQPAHMRDYQQTSDDNGGVHINSGIPNHVFYLAATAIGGETWTVLGRIWYVTLTARVSAAMEFQAFANATVLVAGQIYGVGGSVQRIVVDAWEAVGISVPVALTMHPAIKARRIGPSQQ